MIPSIPFRLKALDEALILKLKRWAVEVGGMKKLTAR
jgi:hypothetical protein